MKSCIFTLAAILLAAALFAQHRAIEFEHGTWSEITAKAKKEKKMIFLDAYASWCGPCKWMAKNVFTNDTVADFYNKNFICAKMDMEVGEGKDLARKYEIKAYPTLLYIDANEEMLHRTLGAAPAQKFIEDGKDALQPEKQIITIQKRMESGIADPFLAYTYLSKLKSVGAPYETGLANYFKTQKESDLKTRNNWKIIYDFVQNPDAKEFNYLVNNKETYAALSSKDSVDNKIIQVYTSGLMNYLSKKDMTSYEALRTKLKKSDNPHAEKALLSADMKLYSNTQEWNSYAIAAISYADKYAFDNYNTLNSMAWSFYENINDKGLLSKAETWAKRSIELKSVYANNDTYAAVLYKLGKKAEAKIAAEKAIELAKKDGMEYKETEELLGKINLLK